MTLRGLTMTTKSVFYPARCQRCAKQIRVNDPFLGTTIYVDAERRTVRHQSNPWVEYELELQLCWHRRCMDTVLLHTPRDPFSKVEQDRFVEYRNELIESISAGRGGDDHGG